MQFDEAIRLRESWQGKSCNHLSIEKEYYLGSDTMDYICSQCGKEFTLAEKKVIENMNENEN